MSVTFVLNLHITCFCAMRLFYLQHLLAMENFRWIWFITISQHHLTSTNISKLWLHIVIIQGVLKKYSCLGLTCIDSFLIDLGDSFSIRIFKNLGFLDQCNVQPRLRPICILLRIQFQQIRIPKINKVSMRVCIHLMLTFNCISNCCKLLWRLFFSNFQLHRTLKTYKLTNKKT